MWINNILIGNAQSSITEQITVRIKRSGGWRNTWKTNEINNLVCMYRRQVWARLTVFPLLKGKKEQHRKGQNLPLTSFKDSLKFSFFTSETTRPQTHTEMPPHTHTHTQLHETVNTRVKTPRGRLKTALKPHQRLISPCCHPVKASAPTWPNKPGW